MMQNFGSVFRKLMLKDRSDPSTLSSVLTEGEAILA